MQTHHSEKTSALQADNLRSKKQVNVKTDMVQRMPDLEEEGLLQGKFVAAFEGQETRPKVPPVQRQANKTGLPHNLKSGIENLSGYSMDDVKVHYNSDQPAQLNAHAYAQGTNIHLAPGQEKHLPHEAWHVVQQKQGRVRPTMQLKDIGSDMMNRTANTPDRSSLYEVLPYHQQIPEPSHAAPLQRKVHTKNTVAEGGKPIQMHHQGPGTVIQARWRTLLGLVGLGGAVTAAVMEAPAIAAGLAVVGAGSLISSFVGSSGTTPVRREGNSDDAANQESPGQEGTTAQQYEVPAEERVRLAQALGNFAIILRDPFAQVEERIPNVSKIEKQMVLRVFNRGVEKKGISLKRIKRLSERLTDIERAGQHEGISNDVRSIDRNLTLILEKMESEIDMLLKSREREAEDEVRHQENEQFLAGLAAQERSERLAAEQQEAQERVVREQQEQQARSQRQREEARKQNRLQTCIGNPTAGRIATCFVDGTLLLGEPTRHYQTTYEARTDRWALEYALTGNPVWVVHGHVSRAGVNIRAVSIKLAADPTGDPVLSDGAMSVALRTQIIGQMEDAGEDSPARIAEKYADRTLRLPEG